MSLNQLSAPRQFTSQPILLRVFAVGLNFPFPDHDGGSRHLYELLKGFVALGCIVDFFPRLPVKLSTSTIDLDQAAAMLEQAGVHAIYSAGKSASFVDYLTQFGHTYDMILLWPENIAMDSFPLIQALAPQAVIVFNTIDLAHIRLFRKAKLSSSLLAVQGAIQAKRREVWLVSHCDFTLVVSDVENEILQALCPLAEVRVVPSVWPVAKTEVLYSEREGLLFFGSFPYAANVDAVEYFVEEILPLIQAQIGPVPFYIVGVAPPPEIEALAASHKNIIVTGQVPSLDPYLAAARVCVSPLRYGAGIKTKNLYSMSYGLPIVTTSIGAEGIHLEHEANAMIADDPELFAEAVVSLYQDAALWSRLASNARQVVETHFSEHALKHMLNAFLPEIEERLLEKKAHD